MQIFIAKSAGFCFGVKRAINMAEKCAEDTHSPIYTLGPIIHNPQAVKRLEESNVYAKKGLDEISEGTVIIRSHGAKLEEHKAARDKGLNVVDATCPFVKKAQDLVSMLAKEGYAVIVVGEKDHPEVMGLVSYSPADILVVESPEELENMPRRKKIGIVAQTTVPMERLEAVVKFCVSRASEIKVFNTICNATSIRQEETADLAGKVGVMIIVGGRNSANTRRLAEICRTVLPKNTHHVETADELELSWFDGVKSAGITSGASTPDWIINGVVEKIKSFTSEGIRASSKL